MPSPDTDTKPFVRAFVALTIADSVRQEIARIQGRLMRVGAHVSWIRPQNLHLSLEFLGDLSRDTLPAVTRVIKEAAATASGFSLTIHGIGSFGRSGSPRVIWAGVRACPSLHALQSDVHEGLIAIGLPLEERPFRPHLTIGRVRSSRGRKELAAALVPLEDTAFGTSEINNVTLMESVLRPSGPEYTPLHCVPFGA